MAAVTSVAGCGSEADTTSSNDVVGGKKGTSTNDPNGASSSPEVIRERPWEVLSNKGETYLADVFYAEPIENEQVMPWAIDGRPVIDRLVYPTLGNPNLFVRDDAADELVMVTRIEADAIAHLAPNAPASTDGSPRPLTLETDDANDIAFFLVAKNARARATESGNAQSPGDGVYRITPSKMLVNAEPADMPDAFKRRSTIRFVFDQAAMQNVPPGLYDARFEVRKNGKVYANVFEWQYNAVRVFQHESEEYTALNVTDTQVSVGSAYATITADMLDQFVDNVNGSSEPNVRNAAFITFNGDLHNGGSPGSLTESTVATTYNDEAKRVIAALKRLDYPIFLTPGNHDGYASVGHVPGLVESFDAKVGTTLEGVIDLQNNIAWPDYSWSALSAFLDKSHDTVGGLHRDIYQGAFKRSPGDSFATSFSEVPRSDRNMILYDGFYQWKKTYGPLYASWTFAKNRYVSMNTYELRQHRRTGWGMYTVNYGGGVSKVQLDWLDRELVRATVAAQDVVLVMHHDPRGGHLGKDFGYYFPLLNYQSIAQSTLNYLLGEVFLPLICKNDDLDLSIEDRDSCLHDGLQEWMGPDEDFDHEGSGYFLSGVELLQRIAQNSRIRTLLIGHAHLNSLEMKQSGDALVPNRIALDDKSNARIEALELANPVRRFAWENGDATREGSRAAIAATKRTVAAWRDRLAPMLAARTSQEMPQKMLDADDGGPRELAIVRLTSNADLSDEKYGAQSMYGYSVLHVNKQAGGVPRINRVTYMINAGSSEFDQVATVDLDRTASFDSRAPTNPAAQLFKW
ncbi:hypothetical protein AKJ09_01310 [Labilithrix luteola]|uniref:Calcineurin-like phosphoesterase domain-containing protein n=1 Tax=Labilithrix luteola TaxID=1391654 RepID=A0A0K1PMK7_9BACT|nr:hypothetical protein AKJ09_01310 [Labilithrix luteola]